MKQISIILLIVSATCIRSFSQVIWSAPVTVTTGSTFSNLHPRIALDRSGNPLVLWGKANMAAYFSKWSGTSFTPPTALNPMSTLPVFSLDWAGPDLASFGDTVYAVMKHTPETVNTNYTYIVHSYNGGSTFSSPVRIDNIDTSLSRFPFVTTDATGNPIVAFMKGNSMFTNVHYVTTRSSDYGLTFSPDVQASGTSGEVCDCCPASLISSGSKLIVLYRNNLSNIRDTWAAISGDGGMTFPGNINIDNNAWMVSMCPSSGPDGFVTGDSIYAVFRTSAGGSARVYFSRASISGLTSAATPITGTISGLLSQDFPRIANAGAAATAVWKQNVTGTGVSIAYSFTNDIAAGFTSYSTLTSATGTGIKNADVIMSPGAIHIVWEDDNSTSVKYIKGTYTVPSSVVKIATRERITIYPNPATDDFSVDLGNSGNLTASYLTDNLGRQLNLEPLIKGRTATFSLKGIAKGSYYFAMTDESGKTFYSKIMVK